MSLERKARLEALPGWSWEFREDSWEEGFRYLKEFTDREGHANVSLDFKTADGYKVGFWVANLRRRKDTLSSERKARLEELPGWSWDRFTAMWENGFRNLKEFTVREGHAEVPQNCKMADGFPLGSWVTTQRISKDNIPLERMSMLEALPGWTWNTVDKKWNEGFCNLKEFAETNGHANAPIDYKTEDGYRLGQWVSVQRGNKNNMSSERKARLETLPDWSWDPHTAKWEKGFGYLKEFVERERNCLPPALYKTEDGYERKLHELTHFFRSSIWSSFQTFFICFVREFPLLEEDIEYLRNYDKKFQEWDSVSW